MSAAGIDRYLTTAKATDQIKDKPTTQSPALLCISIRVRKADDEVEAEPGFFEGDPVGHCGPTLKGEFARTLNLTALRKDGHWHPLRGNGIGLRQRHRIPQQAGDRLGREQGHPLHPIPALEEELPGHHRIDERSPGTQIRHLQRSGETPALSSKSVSPCVIRNSLGGRQRRLRLNPGPVKDCRWTHFTLWSVRSYLPGCGCRPRRLSYPEEPALSAKSFHRARFGPDRTGCTAGHLDLCRFR